MEKKKELELMETVLLLLDGVSEAELMIKYGFGPYLSKAKEIVRVIKN